MSFSSEHCHPGSQIKITSNFILRNEVLEGIYGVLNLLQANLFGVWTIRKKFLVVLLKEKLIIFSSQFSYGTVRE